LFGNGEIWPVRAEALPVLSACDGRKSIADLRRQFTDQEIELIQELWNSGLVDID
jgi:hypothetical protein